MVDPENKVPENKVRPADRQYPETARQLEQKTTGHNWDGIEEYDNPMPRWWLWTFYITIVWAFGYMILYPAWPLVSGVTAGILGYSSRADVESDIGSFEERNQVWFQMLVDTDIAALRDDAELERFAAQAGGAVFAAQCSQCHGAGGAGVQAAGYPNLLHDSWLWGGTLEDIHQTVRHGIRTDDDPQTRFSQMPAYGRDGILDEQEIEQTVEFVLSLSGREHDDAMAADGAETYAGNCAACHGAAGEGNTMLGAPALDDQIWYYGGDRESIRTSIHDSRFGIMPAFAGRLREADIRAVTVYVHQLGGGE